MSYWYMSVLSICTIKQITVLGNHYNAVTNVTPLLRSATAERTVRTAQTRPTVESARRAARSKKTNIEEFILTLTMRVIGVDAG